MIQADWTFALWAVLAALAALGFWSDRTRLGRNVSGLAIVLATGMLLSNLGVLPKQAPVYNVVWVYLVPLAIPLLLLKADLRRVLAETRGMLVPFVLGAVGTILGALLGIWLLPLGEHTAKLAGVFSATYIGGSMNMAAVTQAVDLDPSVATASVAADNVVGVFYLAFLALAPSLSLLRRWFRVTGDGSQMTGDESGHTPNDGSEPESAITPLDPLHLGIAVALSFTICAVGQALAIWFGVGGYAILFITALTVLLANAFPHQLRRLEGDYEIGLFLMYLFFAAIGISADVAAMISSALEIAAFAAIIVLCHALAIFGLGRLFRTDLMDSVIASNACAAGPASAAAMAAGKGRPDLVAPAVLLGVFGYAVANFIGVGLTSWLAG
ncbi:MULTISPECIES: DUF819 domain-containing protein [unclassified Wenzhouxiangella]|uniref:DUF819 family protein n=1 Tax=unclassified Wenzhouxiangella TaxID=2613841 RepID=UPI000E328A47|nr:MULTISPECIES: DUF819 family protein [unclassified Wenzhouxiangella]RFF26277.1 DUF819 family protein [Wenzhouxiangella sp. 15181]RFP67452.1 DUF819 family protein [Wenzhouxiangella sp. 15190]